MKKKAYSDPYMEIVLLNGAPAPFPDDGTGSESLDYSNPVE